MGALTVRENLAFSAALRLPSHMTKEQRKERVQKVINDLGLQGCADQMVLLSSVRESVYFVHTLRVSAHAASTQGSMHSEQNHGGSSC